MSQIPENRTVLNTAAQHISDHNEFARLHNIFDGSTPGGGQTLILADDEDVTLDAVAGTTIVLYTAITEPRSVFLPPASSPSMIVIVKDLQASCDDEITITLVADGTDNINDDPQIAGWV